MNVQRAALYFILMTFQTVFSPLSLADDKQNWMVEAKSRQGQSGYGKYLYYSDNMVDAAVRYDADPSVGDYQNEYTGPTGAVHLIEGHYKRDEYLKVESDRLKGRLEKNDYTAVRLAGKLLSLPSWAVSGGELFLSLSPDAHGNPEVARAHQDRILEASFAWKDDPMLRDYLKASSQEYLNVRITDPLDNAPAVTAKRDGIEIQGRLADVEDIQASANQLLEAYITERQAEKQRLAKAADLAEERERLRIKHDEYVAGFSLLAIGAERLGNQKLANGLRATSFVISRFSELSRNASSYGSVAMVNTSFMTLMTASSMISAGSGGSQFVVKSIVAELRTLRREMKDRFDKVDRSLERIYVTLIQRFEAVESELSALGANQTAIWSRTRESLAGLSLQADQNAQALLRGIQRIQDGQAESVLNDALIAIDNLDPELTPSASEELKQQSWSQIRAFYLRRIRAVPVARRFTTFPTASPLEKLDFLMGSEYLDIDLSSSLAAHYVLADEPGGIDIPDLVAWRLVTHRLIRLVRLRPEVLDGNSSRQAWAEVVRSGRDLVEAYEYIAAPYPDPLDRKDVDPSSLPPTPNTQQLLRKHFADYQDRMTAVLGEIETQVTEFEAQNSGNAPLLGSFDEASLSEPLRNAIQTTAIPYCRGHAQLQLSYMVSHSGCKEAEISKPGEFCTLQHNRALGLIRAGTVPVERKKLEPIELPNHGLAPEFRFAIRLGLLHPDYCYLHLYPTSKADRPTGFYIPIVVAHDGNILTTYYHRDPVVVSWIGGRMEYPNEIFKSERERIAGDLYHIFSDSGGAREQWAQGNLLQDDTERRSFLREHVPMQELFEVPSVCFDSKPVGDDYDDCFGQPKEFGVWSSNKQAKSLRDYYWYYGDPEWLLTEIRSKILGEVEAKRLSLRSNLNSEILRQAMTSPRLTRLIQEARASQAMLHATVVLLYPEDYEADDEIRSLFRARLGNSLPTGAELSSLLTQVDEQHQQIDTYTKNAVAKLSESAAVLSRLHEPNGMREVSTLLDELQEY